MGEEDGVGGGTVLRAREQRVEFLPGLELAFGVEFQRKDFEAFDGLHTILEG